MAKMMVVLHGHDPELTLTELLQRLQLEAHEVDLDYGVQLIDPAVGDYVMLIEESAAQRIDPAYATISGPYADTPIETFGPPK